MPLLLAVGAARAQRNDTGQTACTATDGAPASCTDPASPHPGQDARFGRDAQAGAAAFDFTQISGGCVVDGVTGITWSDETLAAGPWAAANGMAYSRCGIDSGWRLPTRRELLSIVHHGASHPASAFPGTQSTPYWSSDVQGSAAWAVDFTDGDTRKIAQAETHAARLVVQPVNQPPTITLGADIVIPREERPGPRSYPGWATGIGPGPAREAGQHLAATVTLLPVTGQKALEFEVPPAIDLATGELTFTVKHKLVVSDTTPPPYNVMWESSAGLARVQLTLQDDGGTAGGGVDSVTRTFEIFLDPVPRALDIPLTWVPGCHGAWNDPVLPVTLLGWDADTDPERVSPYVFENTHWPTFRITQYPHYGFLDGNDDQVMPARLPFSVLDGTPVGNYNVTMLYRPFSSTWSGVDSYKYTITDKDGNESNEATVTILISQPPCNGG
ncbi:MAG: DUF1566 domain-containing protein [Ottowia sp.]